MERDGISFNFKTPRQCQRWLCLALANRTTFFPKGLQILQRISFPVSVPPHPPPSPYLRKSLEVNSGHPVHTGEFLPT